MQPSFKVARWRVPAAADVRVLDLALVVYDALRRRPGSTRNTLRWATRLKDADLTAGLVRLAGLGMAHFVGGWRPGTKGAWWLTP